MPHALLKMRQLLSTLLVLIFHQSWQVQKLSLDIFKTPVNFHTIQYNVSLLCNGNSLRFFKTLMSLSDIHNIENSRRKWMTMKNKHFFVSHLNNLKMLNDPGARMLCCSSSSFGPYAWLGYKGIAREFLKTCFEGKWKGVFAYWKHWRDRCKSRILDRGVFCHRQR